MKHSLYFAAVLVTLLFANQAQAQISVDTVGELRRALNNPSGTTTITVTSDITAGANVTAETDMQDDSLITDPPTRNFQYAGYDNDMLTGNYIGAKVYWSGGTFTSGTNAFEKSTQQAITGLTLQGSGSGTTIGLDNSAHSTKSVGQLLEMDFYENLTLKNLTLTGAQLNARYNITGTDRIEAYGGTVFNGNTGTLTFEDVNVTNNHLLATKQSGTNIAGVGAGGMRLINSDNIIFDGTKFSNNSAEYSNGAEASAAGNENYSAQGGGLYVGTFNTLQYTGTNVQDFVNNKVITSDANADAGALIVRVDNRAATADFSNLEFANNTATVNVTDDLTNGVAARAGAALIINEGNTDQLTTNFTNINVHNNSATVTNVNAKNVQTNSEAIGGGFASAGGNVINFKDSTFADNAAVFQKGEGNARGGAIAVSDAVTDTKFGNVTFNVENTMFTGNKATADTGAAFGGAVSVIKTQGTTTVDSTFTDSSFENNAVAGATASGGAIYADTDLITIKAVNKDVLFSGNTANGLTDSVYAENNLTYDIAAGRTITDKDKITVGGDLNVKGKGSADIRTVNVTGATIIDGATVSISDLENSSTGTSTTLKGNGTLILGDATNNTTIGNFTQEDGTVKGGIFTAWNYDETAKTLMAAQREKADMNDGFLAAFGMHSRNTVWKAVRDQMISGSGRFQMPQQAYYGQGYYGQEAYEQEVIPYESATPYESMTCDPYASLGYDPCAPATAAYPVNSISPNTAWVNYTGRSDAFRSSYNGQDWKTSMEGLQVGTDLFRSRYSQLGLLFGSEDGKSTNGLDRINGDDMYLGVYAAAVLQGGADIRGVFGYGWQEYDLNRWSDSLYTSSFKGHTIEGNLEIGKRFASGPWSLRPALGVDVISNEIDGAVETGGAGAVRYDDTKMTQLFVRAGTDLRYKVRGFTLNSGIYYAYDVSGEDLNAGVSSIDGLYASQLTGTELGRSMLLFNLGGSLQLTRNLALIGGYQGESVLGSDNNAVQSTGYIGGSWKW